MRTSWSSGTMPRTASGSTGAGASRASAFGAGTARSTARVWRLAPDYRAPLVGHGCARVAGSGGGERGAAVGGGGVGKGSAVRTGRPVGGSRGPRTADASGAFGDERRRAAAMEGARHRQAGHAAANDESVVRHDVDGRAIEAG